MMSLKRQSSGDTYNIADILPDMDLLQCMICFESFKEPKMLNCAHTFCTECLEGYQSNYAGQKRAVADHIPCPNCRELTPWPANGAAGLRTDFKVHQIEDLLKTMSTQVQNASSLNFCSSCNAQNKKVQTSSYCFNCEKSYCISCTNKHSKNALFNSHRVVELSNQKNGSKGDRCRMHPDEDCMYLCRTCNSLVCTLCLINDHNKHKAVELKIVKKEQLAHLNALHASVNERRCGLLNSLNEFEHLLTQYYSACADAEKAVTTRCAKLVSDIKKQEEELMCQIRATREKKLGALEREVNRIRTTLSHIKGIENLMNDSTLTPSTCFKTYELLMQRMKTMIEVDSYEARGLRANAVLIQFIPTQEKITSLGQLSESKVKGQSSYPVGLADPKRGSRLYKGNNCAESVSLTVTLTQALSRDVSSPRLLVEIKTRGDQPGEILEPTWVASLMTSRFVVSERGNRRLQIFDINGKTLGIISDDAMNPCGVSVTLKNNIIVADSSQKCISVFTSDGKSISKWGDGKFFSPCGVTVCPNGNIAVSDVGNNSVSVYRSENESVFQLGISAQSDQQFGDPSHVCNGPHNEIIISDSKNNCLKIFDSKGKFLKKIGSKGSGDGEFDFPCGVCTNHDGNLLVADHGNDRVSMVTRNGTFLCHLLTRQNGIKSPRALCFTQDKLIVTESSPSRSVVKVFHLPV